MQWYGYFLFFLLLKFNFSSSVGKKVFSMMIMIKQLFLCCKYYPEAFFFKVAPAHIFLICNFTRVDIV